MENSSTHSVAEYITDFFKSKGIKTAYQLSGGMIAFLTDAMFRREGFTVITNRQEQASGFAAEGASRINMQPQVAMATSGPGATNLITAIGSCFFDSSPVIFLTGQVNQAELRQNKSQRQNGFQELDIVSAVKGFTKFSQQVLIPEEIPAALESAWYACTEGRPGPVLLDIPIDVQQKQIERFRSSPAVRPTSSPIPSEVMEQLRKLLSESVNPVILAGGGIRTSQTVASFKNFVERTNLPVFRTLLGNDVLNTEHSHNIGFIGSYGNRWANQLLRESDLILVLGSRLDVRQTGNSVASFIESRKIIRVDVDIHEITGRIPTDLAIESDLGTFFESCLELDYRNNSQTIFEKAKELHAQFPPATEQTVELELNPDIVMKWISKQFSQAAGYVVDVGQHQMWAAQSLNLGENQRFLTSGGMGAMGFSLPASIGASIESGEPWVVIAGDGCTQLSIAELQTVFQLDLPIKIIVINNAQHGMVAQFQDENMNSRYAGTRDGYSVPDFVKVAEAFGIQALKISNLSDFDRASTLIEKSGSKPLLIEIQVSDKAKALPKMAVQNNKGSI